jgi:high-affinity Fe2+/Pb2+ permease
MGIEVLIPLGSFVVTGAIVYLLAKASVAKSEHRLHAHGKMLDRFGSSNEFVAFLRTPEGRRYLDSVSIGPRKTQKAKIIGAVRTGVVITIFAIGLMALSFLVGFRHPMQEPPFVIGFLGLFLGAGFLASAAVSFSLAKAWKMDDPAEGTLQQ